VIHSELINKKTDGNVEIVCKMRELLNLLTTKYSYSWPPLR